MRDLFQCASHYKTDTVLSLFREKKRKAFVRCNVSFRTLFCKVKGAFKEL